METLPTISFEYPWMPRPGPDFIAEAASKDGISLSDSTDTSKKKGSDTPSVSIETVSRLYGDALYRRDMILPVALRGRMVPAQFLPGHIWGVQRADGPREAKVMLIGKNPGRAELAQGRNFCGEASEPFHEAIASVGIPESELNSWYVTNAVKHIDLDPQSTRLTASVIKNCKPLLQMELSLIRPEFVLIMGGDAASMVFDEPIKVSDVFGEVLPLPIPYIDSSGAQRVHTAKAMVVTHPAAAYHNPDSYDEWRDGLSYFYSLVLRGDLFAVETDVHHEVISSDDRLREVVDMIVADPDPASRIIALDCEWEGRYPTEPNAYLRTIQFSHKPKHGYVIRLHDQGFFHDRVNKLPCVTPEAARVEMLRLCKSTPARPVRVGGQYLRADMPWLIHAGIDLRDEYFLDRAYTGVSSHSEFARCAEATRTRGGWDTLAMTHAFEETAEKKLEVVGLRLCGTPRYDVPVLRAKKFYIRSQSMKAGDLTGYGFLPDDVIEKYAAYDADLPRRLFDRYNGVGGQPGLLDSDRTGRSCRLGYYLTMLGGPALLEIEMLGLEIDKGRVDRLTFAYMDLLGNLKRNLADIVGWPQFNHASAHHRREWLFGQTFNGRKDGGSVRSDGRLVSLAMRPVKATGKSGLSWDDVEARGLTDSVTPSTDAEVLGILAHTNSIVWALRDTRFIGHLLNTTLRPPSQSATDLSDGEYTYEKGIASWADSRGIVRTHLTPVETGRDSSWDPNLQNLASRREGDYQRIAGQQYKYPIRSCLRAKPGCVLIDIDIMSAELAAIGWLADDPNMKDDVRRNMLPKSDPNYIDIHSTRAVEAFNLSCAPTAAGLESIGKASLRVAAKNVNFGIPYGRQAEAISRQCREEGNPVSVDDASALIDGYYRRYGRIQVYLRTIEELVVRRGWICGGFGRLRRFHPASTPKQIAEQQRSAKNFPIQNTVSDALRVIKRNLISVRDETYPASELEAPFRVAMAIHDAVTLEVRAEYVDWVIDYVAPECFVHRLPFYPYDLDGQPMGVDTPYRFGYDCKISKYWGLKLTRDEGVELGLSESTISKYCG